MIAVTRLDGRQVLINADLIESIEQTPDTIVSFSSGHKLIVRDMPADIQRRVIEYRRTLLAGQTIAEASLPGSETSGVGGA